MRRFLWLAALLLISSANCMRKTKNVSNGKVAAGANGFFFAPIPGKIYRKSLNWRRA